MPKKSAVKKNPKKTCTNIFGCKKFYLLGFTDIKKEARFLCSCCATSIILFLTVINLGRYLYQPRVLGAFSQNEQVATQSQDMQQEVEFWKQFLEKHPGYLQGYLEVAQIECQLNNTEKGKEMLDLASQIDPNSPKVKEIKTLYCQ